MRQLTFLSQFETDVGFARGAEQKSKHETPYFELRGKKLLDALNLIEQAEALLREAQVAASESECRGILYRIRRIFVKTDGLKRAINQKKLRLDMRMKDE